ncbi:MAG: lamin tail domain-containing protein [Sedimentisphaerales bacterium]|nr:lamin tail domain-containing protein [Sedimentisphaerales bacterium]
MSTKRRYRYVLIATIILLGFWVAQPCSALVVSEIMYHPVEDNGTPDGNEVLEFIELYNNRAVFEDLGGCSFNRGIHYTFPAGTILGAKEYLVVALNPTAVEEEYGITGVYGPFSGKLDNDGERVEMVNECREIVISLSYKDTWPWPSSPDGTGHSLIYVKQGGDPEEASSWSGSTYIGGSPGAADVVQAEPPDPILVTLIDIGHAGRYFKGTQEPSPGPGGIATTDWTEVGFDDDPATTDWLEGPSGYGYSNDDDERQWIRTFLNDMNGGYISVYARLRFTLTAEEIASFTGLRAEVHYDDGYALYLNGTLVAPPRNLSGNPPAYNEDVGSGSEYSADNLDLTGLKHLLVPGTNVLAIQAHNSDLSGSSDCLGSPVLKAVIEAPAGADDVRARLLINELLTNSDSGAGVDWLEIYNPGPITVDLNNVYISEGRFELLQQYKVPDGVVLAPGEFWSVSEGTPPSGFPFGLGFAGETVFLTVGSSDPEPKPVRVLDAVRFGAVEADVTLGRYPDGAHNFQALSYPTRELPNAMPYIRDVVINEIMYHHGSRDERYEYVELHNKGIHAVSLEGYSFTDGIRYDFNEVSQVDTIPAGGYLVIAKDPNLLETVYDNLTIGVNLCGPYGGELDDHSERLRLSLPIQEIDPCTGEPNTYFVVADEVTYYDGGRWPKWADGMGASMELRDPRSNNNTPDAWADSDESDKADWEYITHTISGSDSRYTHDPVNVFGLMLLNRGDVLLDDLSLDIGGNKLSNSGFESGSTNWRTLGNHVQSFVTTEDSHTGTQSMHLVATGHGDPGANRINQSISATTSTVTFSGWARWLRGSRYLLMRTTRETSPVQPPRPAWPFELTMPMDLGTPGRQNTAFVLNRGPEIEEVRHEPVLPAGGEPILVTARVADNDGVGSVTLYYRSEGVGGFTTSAMVDDGSGGDSVAGDKIYTGIIPGASGGTMRAFYIVASDGAASTRFPTMLEPSADVPERTCLVRVGDATASSAFASYRIWISNDVVSVFGSRPNLSNELMDCTFVYDDKDVFYNAKIRLRGSPFIRSGSNWNIAGWNPWRIDFNPDQKFRGREEINLDRTEETSRGPLQERASYWFYRKMGLQYSSQEYVRPVINGNDYRNYEDVQKIDGDYVDAWFPNDNDGYIHKVDDYFEYTADGTGFAHLDEGLIHNSSHPLLPETYRWSFEKRSHREDDEWGHLLDFAEAMNISSSNGPVYEDAIESVVYPQHLAAVLALRHAVGDWDSYGYERGKNNLFYYTMPEGKWYLLPWDIDMTLGGNSRPTNADIFSVGGQFPEIQRFLGYSKYRQMYTMAFASLMYGPWQTSYGTANPPTDFDKFLDDAADALAADGGDASRRDGIKAYVRDRRTYVLGLAEIPTLVFQITTNSGDDFCTTVSVVTIEGILPAGVVEIEVNGEPVSATIMSNNFEVDIPVDLGSNLLEFEGFNDSHVAVPGATDSITVTRVLPSFATSATPPVLCNNGISSLTINGTGFIPGSEPSVTLAGGVLSEPGFDALYVKSSTSFDRIDAATGLLNDPGSSIWDEVYTMHPVVNLWVGDPTASHGVFMDNEEPFAAPYDVDTETYAIRFSGYVYAPSPGTRYFGVNSDDGFLLTINGELVGEYATGRAPATTDVANPGSAGTMTYNFPAPGSYYLVLDFFENGGGQSVELFQTNSTGGDQRLINVDAELVVYRDSIARIEAEDVVVVNEHTVTCQVDLSEADPNMWDVIVTPECEDVETSVLEDAVEVIACRANFNHDGGIDFLDWAELTDNWDRSCSPPLWCDGMDLNHDGHIDFREAAVLAEEWLLPK